MNLRHIISFIRYPGLLVAQTGKNIRLGKKGIIAHYRELKFGNNIYIGPNFHISAHKLDFGNNILIGPNLLIECEDHKFNYAGKTIWATRRDKVLGFVSIEDDVWIGGNVTILKNVVIGEGCIIGAGSVVTKSLPPYTINVGIPCKSIRLRFNDYDLEQHLKQIKSKYSKKNIIEKFNQFS